MKLTLLWEEYKNFLGTLVDLKVLRVALASLPDDLELTLTFEKDQPGGMIKDGMVLIPKQGPFEKLPKTVLQRKEELDLDIRVLGARVNQIKTEIIKELQREDE